MERRHIWATQIFHMNFVVCDFQWKIVVFINLTIFNSNNVFNLDKRVTVANCGWLFRLLPLLQQQQRPFFSSFVNAPENKYIQYTFFTRWSHFPLFICSKWPPWWHILLYYASKYFQIWFCQSTVIKWK